MKLIKTLNEYPAGSLMNPAFEYVPSRATDVRATFDRLRRELAQRPELALGGKRRAGHAGQPVPVQLDLLEVQA